MVAIHPARALVAAAAANYGTGWFNWYGNGWQHGHQGHVDCAINSFVPTLPAGLVAASQPPKFVGLALGVQNYTCSTANNYTSAGALAELIDVSCYVQEPWFGTIQNDLYNVWTDLIQYPIETIIDLVGLLHLPEVLAQHYFVKNPITGQGLSPKWDFTSSDRFAGNKEAFMVGQSKASVPSPDDPKSDVAWLDLVNVEGKIADEIFRIDTVGGQPPATCKYGQDKDISVKYVAKYLFYGGSVH